MNEGAGFDGLSGADRPAGAPDGRSGPGGDRRIVPTGVRTVSSAAPGATRLVLIRHGEAVCNVTGVCGGPIGCEGLTELGRHQVAELRDRLVRTGELAGATARYASILPRAVETAELLAPALDPSSSGAPGEGPPPLVTDCGLCELHPGEADGLGWIEFTERFAAVDWDEDPTQPIAPGGESWTGFVTRVSAALEVLTGRHPGELVVVACHAGVVEASLLAKLPVEGGRAGARLGLQTRHASMTTWEVRAGHWQLLGYNDTARRPAVVSDAAATVRAVASSEGA